MKGWYGNKYGHSLASRGIRSKINFSKHRGKKWVLINQLEGSYIVDISNSLIEALNNYRILLKDMYNNDMIPYYDTYIILPIEMKSDYKIGNDIDIDYTDLLYRKELSYTEVDYIIDKMKDIDSEFDIVNEKALKRLMEE